LGSTTVECMVLNVKPKPVDGVTIEIVDDTGGVFVGLGPMTLFPNDERTVVWVVGADQPAYCRVSRSKGGLSTKNTLVTFCSREGATPVDPCNSTVTLP
jgi:hypothetical protein